MNLYYFLFSSVQQTKKSLFKELQLQTSLPYIFHELSTKQY